ncbi:MAG TPA: polysaccharide pyruvyl transferase family protein [Anaerolineales bacterium]|jgi:polysaccharide pyruvyl transferase CsaB
MTIILIAGYYGFGNLGDEAILSVLLSDLSELSGAQPTVLSGNPNLTSRLHQTPAVDWRDAPAVTRALEQADWLILGGGGLIHDYWPTAHEDVLTSRQHDLSYLAGLVALAGAFGVPVAGYGLGVGPLSGVEAEDLARAVLGACRWLSVRDAGSAQVIKTLGLVRDPESVEVGADLALRLPAWRSSRAGRSSQYLARAFDRPKTLGVSLRYWDFGVAPEVVQTRLAEGLDHWLAQPGTAVRFVPFQTGAVGKYEDDAAMAEGVMLRMEHGSRSSLELAGSFDRAAELIGKCDLWLAGRYHAAIAGLVLGVPTVILSYDPKCHELASAVAAEPLAFDVTRLQEGGLFERLEACLANWPQFEPMIQDQIEQLGAQSELTKGGFLQALQVPLPDRTYSKQSSAILAERLSQGQIAASWMRDQAEVQGSAPRGQEGSARSLANMLHTLRDQHDRLQHRLGTAADERAKLLDRQQALHVEQEALEAEVEAEQRARLQLAAELTAIRGTAGFHLLAAYWGLVSRLAPVGSLRRQWLARLRSLLRQDRGSIYQPVHDRRVGVPQPSLGRGINGVSPAVSPAMPGLGAEYWRKLASAEEAFILVAPTPFNPDEGQRSNHMSLQLAARGIPVLYAHWRWSSTETTADPNPHPLIGSVPLDELLSDPSPVLARVGAKSVWLWVEFPYPGLFDLVALAHGLGWFVLYDVIDNWQAFHSVGQAPWYEPAFESHLANTADVVTATTTSLAGRIEHRTGRRPHVLANAGALALSSDGPGPVQEGAITVGYFGHLSPAWFDWELLTEVARQRPAWRFELVGPPPPRLAVRPPANLQLLGELPQDRLASIARDWHVGIVPFRQGELAQAVDAVKVYEYLALGLPVVVSGIAVPAGAQPHVVGAKGPRAFLTEIERMAERRGEKIVDRHAYAARHTWSQRADELLDYLETLPQRAAEKWAVESSV